MGEGGECCLLKMRARLGVVLRTDGASRVNVCRLEGTLRQKGHQVR